MKYIAGVDEAGRGSLAGEVVAAAVILDPNKPINGLKDSKLLSASQRAKLFVEINSNAMAVGIGVKTVLDIAELNILQATLGAMHLAVLNLNMAPDLVIVDGNVLPKWPFKSKAIVNGDKLEPAIAAASIIAKVTRDNMMLELDLQYPEYGLAMHKGYGTQQHIAAIKKYGATAIHREKFLSKILT